MALYVNTNVSSLNAQRKLTNATNSLNVSYQRLSSGLRINSAKDDAAGLMISNRLTAQINGLNQGNRNANDGIALAQTIEGALDETANMLQRIRVLANQAATGTNTPEDRLALQKEVSHLSSEITRIARKTTFAGAQVLDGITTNNNDLLDPNTSELFFQVGANAWDRLTLEMNGFTMSAMMDDLGFAVGKIAASTGTAVIAQGTTLDRAIFVGTKCYGVGYTVTEAGGLTPDNYGIGSAGGLILDGDLITDSGKFGVRWSVSTAESAQYTLKNIDAFIQHVDSKRANLGAIQNRMESTIRNQSSISENESDARSRIRDTDFASETAALTQNNIIQQASQSVLAQANQRPTIALNLLGQ